MSRKRNQGSKLPMNFTKIEILLFLANKGRKERRDILDYLKTKYNICDAKTVDSHLKDLQGKNLIQKNEIGLGKPISYSLSEGYNGFKNLIRFMNLNNSDLNFLKSPHAQKVINEKLIPNITRDIINLFSLHCIKILITDVEQLKNNPEYSSIADEIINDPELYETISRYRKDNQEKIDQMKSIDENQQEFADAISSTIEEFIKIPPFFDVIQNLLFPIRERYELIEILKSSPSALDFIILLDSKKVDIQLTIISAYIRYYSQFLFHLQKQMTNGNKDFSFPNFINDISSKERKVASPILVMMRSLLISDYFAYKIVDTDWIRKFHLNLFIDDEELKQSYAVKLKQLVKNGVSK